MEGKAASRPRFYGGVRQAAAERLVQQAPEEADDKPVDGDSVRLTDRQSELHMINGILGTAALGVPWCFRVCGLVLGTLMLIVCAGVCDFTLRLLLHCASITGRRSYEDLASRTHGNLGRQTVSGCIWILQLGSLVAYTNILADMFSNFAGSIVPPGAEPSRAAIMTLVVGLGLLPITVAIKSARTLARLSTVSLAFVLVFTFAVVVSALAQAALEQSEQAAPLPPLELWRPTGAPIAIPVLAFAFSAHSLIFPVYASLKQPTPRRMGTIARRSLLAVSSIYGIIGVCGYKAFREGTSGDVLRNFGGRGGWWGFGWRGVKLAYGISVVCTVPLLMLPLREALMSHYRRRAAAAAAPPSAEKLSAVGTSVSVALLALVLGIAVLLPNVEFIFGLTGATACALLSWVLPGVIYLELHSGRSRAPPRDDRAVNGERFLPVASSRVSVLAIQDHPVSSGGGGGGSSGGLAGGGGGGGGAGGGFAGGAHPGPGSSLVRALARVVVIGGLLVTAASTVATFQAVRLEADTVTLAKELVAVERHVSTQSKAIETAGDVATKLVAVTQAAGQLTSAKQSAVEAMGQLQEVAAALDGAAALATGGGGGGGKSGSASGGGGGGGVAGRLGGFGGSGARGSGKGGSAGAEKTDIEKHTEALENGASALSQLTELSQQHLDSVAAAGEAIHGLSAAASAAVLVAEAPEPRISRVGDGAHARLSRAGIVALGSGGAFSGASAGAAGDGAAAARVGSEETDLGWRLADSTAVQSEGVRAPPGFFGGGSAASGPGGGTGSGGGGGGGGGGSGKAGSVLVSAFDSVSAARGSVLEGTGAQKKPPVAAAAGKGASAAGKKGTPTIVVDPRKDAIERNLTNARTNSTIEALKKTAGAVQVVQEAAREVAGALAVNQHSSGAARAAARQGEVQAAVGLAGEAVTHASITLEDLHKEAVQKAAEAEVVLEKVISKVRDKDAADLLTLALVSGRKGPDGAAEGGGGGGGAQQQGVSAGGGAIGGAKGGAQGSGATAGALAAAQPPSSVALIASGDQGKALAKQAVAVAAEMVTSNSAQKIANKGGAGTIKVLPRAEEIARSLGAGDSLGSLVQSVAQAAGTQGKALPQRQSGAEKLEAAVEGAVTKLEEEVAGLSSQLAAAAVAAEKEKAGEAAPEKDAPPAAGGGAAANGRGRGLGDGGAARLGWAGGDGESADDVEGTGDDQSPLASAVLGSGAPGGEAVVVALRRRLLLSAHWIGGVGGGAWGVWGWRGENHPPQQGAGSGAAAAAAAAAAAIVARTTT